MPTLAGTGAVQHYIPRISVSISCKQIFYAFYFYKIWDVVVVELLPGANPEAAKAMAAAAQVDVTG
ncbi:hypothetical protein JMG10_19350 [Nostoc ellipsosporum NOK]|nr:hypothetical protein [Nostoc ellipsosporum NOK]